MRTGARWGRWPTAFLALLAGLAAAGQWLGWRQGRAELLAELEATGIAARNPELTRRLAREPDLPSLRSHLARALLADALDPGWIAALPPAEAREEASRIPARLARAAVLARDCLSTRPTAWEAMMVVGGSAFLEAWSDPTRAHYRETHRWQVPLSRASEIAPGAEEPQRLLAAAYLTAWHALPSRERELTRGLLRTAFRDPATLDRLLPLWLAAAGEEATVVLPDEARAWSRLAELRAAAGDWQAYCVAHDRWRRLLREELEGRLSEAQARRRGGDVTGARAALLGVVGTAPIERSFAPLVEVAMRELPPGPSAGPVADRLALWVDWSNRQWRLGLPSLATDVLRRVVPFARELPPPEQAVALLAADELVRAEAVARRSDRLWSEEWAPYVVARAGQLGPREPDAARELLADLHLGFANRVETRRVLARLEGRQGPARGFRNGAEWGLPRPATAWRWESGVPRLELWLDEPAASLSLHIDETAKAGAAASVLVDGVAAGCLPVATGTVVPLPFALEPGPHLVVLESLAGGRITPGRLEAAPPEPVDGRS